MAVMKLVFVSCAFGVGLAVVQGLPAQRPMLTIDTTMGGGAHSCDGETPPLASPISLHGRRLTWPFVVDIVGHEGDVVGRGETLALDVLVRSTADVLIPLSSDRCQPDGSSWHRATGYRMMTVWAEAVGEGKEGDLPSLVTTTLYGAESVPGSTRALRSGEVVVIRLADRLSWNPRDGRSLPKNLRVRAVVGLVDGQAYRPLVRSKAEMTIQTR
jgi:hypothetical protein